MSQTFDRTFVFEKMPLREAIVSQSVPCIMAFISVILFNLTDLFFVTNLNSAAAIAAVGFASSAMIGVNFVTNLFGGGSASLLSRSEGKKDHETAIRAGLFAVYGTIVVSIAYSFLFVFGLDYYFDIVDVSEESACMTEDYIFYAVIFGGMPSSLRIVFSFLLRGEGFVKEARNSNIIPCVLNFILDPLFIMPQFLDMGVAGAALATCLTNVAGCLYSAYIFKTKCGLSFDIRLLHLDFSLVKEIIPVGLPGGCQTLFNVVCTSVVYRVAAQYGVEVAAAMGVANQIAMLPQYISMGISQGIVPLVGYNYGARNLERMKAIIKKAIKIDVLLMLACTALGLLISNAYIALMDDTEYYNCLQIFMNGYFLCVIFVTLDFLGTGVMTALGKGKLPLAFAFLRKIVLEISFIYLLNYLFPKFGIAFSQTATEIVMCIFVLLTLRRILAKCQQ